MIPSRCDLTNMRFDELGRSTTELGFVGGIELMRILGRALQLFGLVVLPVAMVLELSKLLGRDFGVSDMVIMLVAGATAFLMGRVIEGYARG